MRLIRTTNGDYVNADEVRMARPYGDEKNGVGHWRLFMKTHAEQYVADLGFDPDEWTYRTIPSTGLVATVVTYNDGAKAEITQEPIIGWNLRGADHSEPVLIQPIGSNQAAFITMPDGRYIDLRNEVEYDLLIAIERAYDKTPKTGA